MNIYCRLGPILAELRSKHGKKYTMGNFAERIGVSLNTISSYANNKQLPKFEIAYRIARELDMIIEEIWIIEEDSN